MKGLNKKKNINYISTSPIQFFPNPLNLFNKTTSYFNFFKENNNSKSIMDAKLIIIKFDNNNNKEINKLSSC